MLKKLWSLFLLSLFFVACAGLSSFSFMAKPSEITTPSGDPFFSSMPESNGLVFIGAVGRRSNPKETIQFALEDAAKKVSVYNQVSGEYAMQHNTGLGLFDYTNNTYTSLEYNVDGAANYVDALQFDEDTDTRLIDNTFFIRVVYPSSLPSPVNYRPTYNSEQKPDWIDNPPAEIAGYEVGIGFSARHSTLASAITNSRNNAVFSIIRNVNTTSRSTNLTWQNTGTLFGFVTKTDNVTYSFGTLNGFYVLDTWIDPKAKTVWTLAIAKSPF